MGNRKGSSTNFDAQEQQWGYLFISFYVFQFVAGCRLPAPDCWLQTRTGIWKLRGVGGWGQPLAGRSPCADATFLERMRWVPGLVPQSEGWLVEFPWSRPGTGSPLGHRGHRGLPGFVRASRWAVFMFRQCLFGCTQATQLFPVEAHPARGGSQCCRGRWPRRAFAFASVPAERG